MDDRGDRTFNIDNYNERLMYIISSIRDSILSCFQTLRKHFTENTTSNGVFMTNFEVF